MYFCCRSSFFASRGSFIPECRKNFVLCDCSEHCQRGYGGICRPVHLTCSPLSMFRCKRLHVVLTITYCKLAAQVSRQDNHFAVWRHPAPVAYLLHIAPGRSIPTMFRHPRPPAGDAVFQPGVGATTSFLCCFCPGVFDALGPKASGRARAASPVYRRPARIDPIRAAVRNNSHARTRAHLLHVRQAAINQYLYMPPGVLVLVSNL